MNKLYNYLFKNNQFYSNFKNSLSIEDSMNIQINNISENILPINTIPLYTANGDKIGNKIFRDDVKNYINEIIGNVIDYSNRDEYSVILLIESYILDPEFILDKDVSYFDLIDFIKNHDTVTQNILDLINDTRECIKINFFNKIKNYMFNTFDNIDDSCQNNDENVNKPDSCLLDCLNNIDGQTNDCNEIVDFYELKDCKNDICSNLCNINTNISTQNNEPIYKNINNNCNDNIDCGDNLYCVNNICTTGNIGASCNNYSECDNRKCVNNICVSGNIGDNCFITNDCNNYNCVRYKCSSGIIGSKCYDNRNCINDNICINGECNKQINYKYI